jgi:hypothetical protein
MASAKIIDIRTRKPRKVMLTKTIVTREEFGELVDKTKELARQLKNVDTKHIIDLLTEMKFSACFNAKFRNRTYPELEELYKDLHARTHNKVSNPK